MNALYTMNTKPTCRQLFVLREYMKPWSPVKMTRAYNQSVFNLQSKGLLRFNEQRGKYEVTPEGVAAIEASTQRKGE